MGSIAVGTLLHCLLQWLGGGSYLEIRLSAGISQLHFIVVHTSAFQQFWNLKIWHIIVLTLQKN